MIRRGAKQRTQFFKDRLCLGVAFLFSSLSVLPLKYHDAIVSYNAESHFRRKELVRWNVQVQYINTLKRSLGVNYL